MKQHLARVDVLRLGQGSNAFAWASVRIGNAVSYEGPTLIGATLTKPAA